jgi:lipid A 4'-phosphatase
LRSIAYLLLFLALIAIIAVSPQVDQYLAMLTYNPITHNFYGETHLWCKIIYHGVKIAIAILIILPLVFLFLAYQIKSLSTTFARRFALITYVSLIVGPGLIVNVGLKEHWGRARPNQVIREHQTYTPLWQYVANKPSNNSFPSGHASGGFFFGIPLLATRRKKLAISVSLLGGFLLGLVRLLEGGHYFSDILMAGILVIAVGLIVTKMVEKIGW